MTFEALRQQYPEFEFRDIDLHIRETETGPVLVIEYFFTLGEEQFSPLWEIPCKTPYAQHKGLHFRYPDGIHCDPGFWRLVFSLGMAELISYWKLACPPEVRLWDVFYGKEQEDWWKRLYFGGLGEFFYRNGIRTDFDSFMQFSYSPDPPCWNYPEKPAQRKDLAGKLIPVGGGKDSIVTLNLLKGQLGDAYAFMINHRDSAEKSALLAGIPQERIIECRRTLDPNLLRLNKEGFLNGHTPFSAVVAFSAALTAYVNGLKTVILSNESSASESTVSEQEVNHQYSKSYQFERDFFEYERKYLRCGVEYFSLLRPLTEFQIARYFAQLPTEFHEAFRSCNAGNARGRKDEWCGHCAKCLFVAVILSPFLPFAEIARLLSSDILNMADMEPVLQELCGALPNKPFECVGSRKEVNIALCQAITRAEREGEALPLLIRQYKASPLYAEYLPQSRDFGQEWDSENNLPDALAELVRRECVTKFAE